MDEGARRRLAGGGDSKTEIGILQQSSYETQKPCDLPVRLLTETHPKTMRWRQLRNDRSRLGWAQIAGIMSYARGDMLILLWPTLLLARHLQPLQHHHVFRHLLLMFKYLPL